jgi:hypothetical protein
MNRIGALVLVRFLFTIHFLVVKTPSALAFDYMVHVITAPVLVSMISCSRSALCPILWVIVFENPLTWWFDFISCLILYNQYYDNTKLRENFILQCEENIDLKEDIKWNRAWLKQLRHGGDLFELERKRLS